MRKRRKQAEFEAKAKKIRNEKARDTKNTDKTFNGKGDLCGF